MTIYCILSRFLSFKCKRESCYFKVIMKGIKNNNKGDTIPIYSIYGNYQLEILDKLLDFSKNENSFFFILQEFCNSEIV